jgi:hypothetical protein
MAQEPPCHFSLLLLDSAKAKTLIVQSQEAHREICSVQVCQPWHGSGSFKLLGKKWRQRDFPWRDKKTRGEEQNH